ncbi:zinc finger protein RFP [Rhodovulum sulfidophilum]|uniref:Zinc finger protein RFP n=2 Tax=Rhodovulum sulfidophilum TaxID=35806 RepID=A0A0D6AXL4_RHOSU|nr:zinc finger protein RFP [Rhodovulum sulfidophilum]
MPRPARAGIPCPDPEDTMPRIPKIPDLPATYGFGTWRDALLGLFIGLAFIGSAGGGLMLARIAKASL